MLNSFKVDLYIDEKEGKDLNFRSLINDLLNQALEIVADEKLIEKDFFVDVAYLMKQE